MQDEFRDFLDAISVCFTDKDFSGWEARIILPFSLITRTGPEVLTTQDALRENFEFYLTACDVMRVDLIHRRPISLEKSYDDTWVGTYETNLLSDGKRVTAPYTSSALLEMGPPGFVMRSIMNARGHHDWTGEHPTGG